MIVAKIAVNKIDKAHLFKGQKHTYLDIAFHENKDGPDEYGNIGFVSQSIGKEARERGEKGPIIGNWKEVGQKKQPPKPAPAPAKTVDEEGDDIPF